MYVILDFARGGKLNSEELKQNEREHDGGGQKKKLNFY